MQDFSLLIVGASARAAAFSACRAGLRMRAADLFVDVDLAELCPATRVIHYPNDFEAIVRDSQVDAWIFTGGLENHPTLVDRMARHRPLLGNHGASLRRARSVEELSRALARAGLRFPECRALGSAPDSGEWLIKPRRGSSGSQIVRAKDAQGWVGSLSPADYYLQRCVPGEPCAAIYVANGAKATLLGASRQLIGADWTGASGFRYAGSIGPRALDDGQEETLRRLGGALAQEFGLRGLFGVDLIVDPEGEIWPIEVNPRYTASVEVLERATGMRAIALHLDACLRSLLAAPPPWQGSLAGKAILYAQRDFVVASDFPRLAAQRNAGRDFPEIADIPTGGQAIKAGRPVLTVFACGESDAAVEEGLRGRLAELRARLGC